MGNASNSTEIRSPGAFAQTLLAAPLAHGVSPEDLVTIEAQIGAVRYRPLSVLTRCPAGFPQVVLGFSGLPGRGFSRQVVWLTCPYVARALAVLESEGAIRSLERQIAQDPVDRAELARDQAEYEQCARALLARHAPWAPLAKNGVDNPFGIGGVSNRAALKCLHSHAAWALVTGRSVAGRRALAQMEARAQGDAYLCPSRRCPGLDASRPAPGASGRRAAGSPRSSRRARGRRVCRRSEALPAGSDARARPSPLGATRPA